MDASSVDRRHTVAHSDRAPWRDVPERYGPWDRVYGWFRRRQREGTWKRIFVQLQPPGGVFTEPDDHGLGRSRGGLTTKLHLAVEQGQKPLSLLVTAGQRHDSPQVQAVLEGIRVPRTAPRLASHSTGRGPYDRAYGSRANRAYLCRRGIRCTIPEKADHARNRKKLGSRGGRPPTPTGHRQVIVHDSRSPAPGGLTVCASLSPP